MINHWKAKKKKLPSAWGQFPEGGIECLSKSRDNVY